MGIFKKALFMSKLFTLMWGVLAITFALFAHMVENLIEAVNILGSLFYGTILGIFIIGLFNKVVSANSVFIAAIAAQSTVIMLYFTMREEIAYLWYNVIACLIVIAVSFLISLFRREKK